jgi:hypothetical protein
MSNRPHVILMRCGVLATIALALQGCVGGPVALSPAYQDEPYALLSVDESMSCEALTASFLFSARRAARLEYWLEIGPPSGFGHARFEIDAPLKLRDEFRRLDALSDQQRYKGCRAMEPRVVVAEERARLEPLPPPSSKGQVVLRSRG